MLKFIILFVLLFHCSKLFSQMEDESRGERFINNFYSKPDHVLNQVFLASKYGLSQLNSFNFTPKVVFDPTQNLEFYYGFIRIDDKTGDPNLFKHQSEYIYLGNISTDFKTLEIENIGIPTDTWRFGFGLNDGFGFIWNDTPTLYLNHSTAFTFARIDFDGLPANNDDYIYAKRFDQKFKFGQSYSGGVRYKLYSIFHLDAGYEISQYYGTYEFLPWFGMWITDNVLQRWIDYFERDLISVLGTNYPWVKFAYKNFISLVSYQIRKHEMYFPFKSEAPLYFESYNIGISLII